MRIRHGVNYATQNEEKRGNARLDLMVYFESEPLARVRYDRSNDTVSSYDLVQKTFSKARKKRKKVEEYRAARRKANRLVVFLRPRGG